ncbi:MAG: hypothetical protein D4R64_10565 [Porphyromonadaceae bacterium]|nr:MAG: hypothetical protein D4R64_10565 [Porphyromonadaceae bacterium]
MKGLRKVIVDVERQTAPDFRILVVPVEMYFHQWVVIFDELTGIVETIEGDILEALPETIHFKE